MSVLFYSDIQSFLFLRGVVVLNSKAMNASCHSCSFTSVPAILDIVEKQEDKKKLILRSLFFVLYLYFLIRKLFPVIFFCS